jgi:hypothetical protein
MAEAPPNRTGALLESSSEKVVRQTPVPLKRTGKNLGGNLSRQLAEDDTPDEFPGWTHKLETHLLMLLSLSTVIIIVLIILTRLNNKHAVGSRCPDKTSSCVKTCEVSSTRLLKDLRRDQKRIAILNAKIQAKMDVLAANESIAKVEPFAKRALKTDGDS